MKILCDKDLSFLFSGRFPVVLWICFSDITAISAGKGIPFGENRNPGRGILFGKNTK